MKKAIDHLARTDPRFAALISRSRRFDVAANELVRPFDALAESIAYQQLAIDGQGPLAGLEGPLDVFELDEAAGGLERHADGVETELGRPPE